MNKKILVFSAIALSALTFAQVGINTETPSATLDIVSSGNDATTKALEINNSAATEMVTVLDNGNVGINNSTPIEQFHIVGPATKVPIMALSEPGVVTWRVGGNDVADDHNLHFRFNGISPTMTVATSNRVGVKTITPQVPLDVNEVGYVGIVSVARFNSSTTPAGGNGAAIEFGTSTNSNSSFAISKIGSKLISGGAANEAGNLVFFTMDAGAMKSNMELDYKGRLGIGKEPTEKLDIDMSDALHGSENKSVSIWGSSTNSANSMVNGIRFNWYAMSANIGLIRRTSSDVDGISFNINDAEKLRIVGDNTESTVLRVLGGASKMSMISVNNPGFITWFVGGNNVASDYDMHIRYNASPDVMTLKSSGAVGVNNPTPEAMLDVNGYIKIGGTDSVGGGTPLPGMIRYNTSTNIFEGYVGGGTPGWVALH